MAASITKTEKTFDNAFKKRERITNRKKGFNTRGQGRSLKKATAFPKKIQSNTKNGPREKLCTLPRPTVRHDGDYLKVLTKKTNKNQLSVPGPDGKEGRALILRPKKNDTVAAENDPVMDHTGEYEVTSDNILVHKNKLMTLINSSIKYHALKKPDCQNIDFDIVEFRPWGFLSSVVLTCKSCGFRSARTKLFEEILSDKRGCNTAATNLRLMILLNFLPIGPTAMYLICAGLGIRPCSRVGMQKLADRASAILQEAGHNDIRKWRQYCIKILADRGVNNPHVLSGSTDTTYHGTTKSSSVTPGTGANQATASVIENVSGQKKVVAVNHLSQPCLVGSRMKAKNIQVYCGEGGEAKHEGCTSDQPLACNIEEYDMAKKMAEDAYNEDGILFSVICSDSDSSAPNAFSDIFAEKAPELGESEWCKDPWHIGKNQRFKTKYHDFAKGTFGPGLTAVKEHECRKAFAIDLVARVSLTLENSFEYWKDDIDKMKKHSKSLTGYIIKCYVGDHSSCSWSPVAQLTGCHGPGEGQCWLKRGQSPFRPLSDLDFIILNKTDKLFIRKVIDMKLSEDSLEYFKYKLSSSRNESFHRTVHHCNAKNTTFTKNSRGRVYAATGTANNNLGEFAEMTMRAAKCPLPENSVSRRVLRSYEKHREHVRSSQAKPESKSRRRALGQMRVEQYFQERKSKTDQDGYRKFKLDQAVEITDQNMERVRRRFGDIREISQTLNQEVGGIDVLNNPLDACEEQIKRALESVEQYKNVLQENIDDIDKFQLKRKQIQENMKAAATKRAKTKQHERSTRSSTNQEHSYGKL